MQRQRTGSPSTESKKKMTHESEKKMTHESEKNMTHESEKYRTHKVRCQFIATIYLLKPQCPAHNLLKNLQYQGRRQTVPALRQEVVLHTVLGYNSHVNVTHRAQCNMPPPKSLVLLADFIPNFLGCHQGIKRPTLPTVHEISVSQKELCDPDPGQCGLDGKYVHLVPRPSTVQPEVIATSKPQGLV